MGGRDDGESELSKKSPLTVTLLSKENIVYDARKFWLLRRHSGGIHC
ncbi:hypothetical protein [Nitrososphaera sp.]